MARTLVFDVDDTICFTKNRDFDNATPNIPVIQKINQLHDQGYKIVLSTARGTLSCNGDLQLRIERNYDRLCAWLKKHGVKYDEVSFMKELGDWYIDDKAMTIDQFLSSDFRVLKGGSKDKVYLEGDKVIKTGPGVLPQFNWYETVKARGFNSFKIPEISSFVKDTLYMEYINGQSMYDKCSHDLISRLAGIICEFAKMPISSHYSFDNTYIPNLESHIKHAKDNDSSINVRELEKLITDLSKEGFDSAKTFCHGDMSLSNVMVTPNNDIYLIDPNYKEESWNSYLLDLSKIRYSLNGYEKLYGISNKSNKKYLSSFDNTLVNINPEIMRKLIMLEATHWMRLFKYKDPATFNIIVNQIRRCMNEYQRTQK